MFSWVFTKVMISIVRKYELFPFLMLRSAVSSVICGGVCTFSSLLSSSTAFLSSIGILFRFGFVASCVISVSFFAMCIVSGAGVIGLCL